MTEPEIISAPLPDGGGAEAYAVPQMRMPYPPYAMLTPPPVPVAPGGAPLAEAWERFVAYVIDAAIQFAAYLIPLAAFVVVIFNQVRASFEQVQRSNDQAIANGRVLDVWPTMRHLFALELIGLAILIPISVAISYVYFVQLGYRNGQTVGKKIMKIKVVRADDGSPVSKAILRKRWLVFHVAAIVAPYFSYADAMWLLWDKPYQQCLHDKCADTVVVKSRP